MDDGLTANTWNINVDQADYDAQPSSNFLYVPLKSLLVNTNYFLNDQGAMNVTVAGVERSLCILRSYYTTADNSIMVNPPPRIIFGSMVLRSLYFTANYEEVTVGLANKISRKDQNRYFSGDKDRCVEKATCIGQQSRTMQPIVAWMWSVKIFFAELDPVTRNCVYKASMYNAGVTIIILCVIFEVSAFFSTIQLLADNGFGQSGGRGKYEFFKTYGHQISPFTATVGKLFAFIFDHVIKFVKYLDSLRGGEAEQHEHEE